MSCSADRPLLEELILVHEHTDHYSKQPTVEMSLEVKDKRQNFQVLLVVNYTLDLDQR